jgi:hypothetical protein
MAKKRVEVWGLREAARHLNISWKLVAKWAKHGLLPMVAEPVQGTITIHGKKAKLVEVNGKRVPERDCLGFEIWEPSTVERTIWRMFKADDIRAITPERMEELRSEWRVIETTLPPNVEEN